MNVPTPQYASRTVCCFENRFWSNNSENIFSFKLDKKMKLTDFKLKSKAEINELIIVNTLKLKDIFLFH